MLPVPTTAIKPHSTKNCHGCVISADNAAPSASSASAAATVRRTPKRSNIPAANGPMSPNSAMLTAIAADIVAGLQPNSFSSGWMSIVGDDRTPAAAISSTNATPATTYA